MKLMTFSEWVREGERRFGTDRMAWRFVCPSCGHVASASDWHVAGAPEGAVAFSCVGRYVKTLDEQRAAADKAFGRSGGPCNYTGGGLFQLNPVAIDFEDGTKPTSYFDFAEEHPAAPDMAQGGAA